MDNTELRQIPFNSKYIISNTGNVWKQMKARRPRYSESNRNRRFHIQHEGNWYVFIRPTVFGKLSNYLRVEIDNRTYSVHRLVLLTHKTIDCAERYQVNHKDRNTFNNNVDNLEWCTHQENQIHRFSNIKPAEYNVLQAQWEYDLAEMLDKVSETFVPQKASKDELK